VPDALAQAQLPKFAEDLELVLNAAFAEKFCGFKRLDERAADGSVQWIELSAKPDAQPLTIDKLPVLKDTQFALCEWLDRFCSDLDAAKQVPGDRFLWSVQRTAKINPEGAPMYVAGVHLLRRDTPMPGVIGKGSSNDPAIAIATAMLQAASIGTWSHDWHGYIRGWRGDRPGRRLCHQ
jgi:hypothetical protein